MQPIPNIEIAMLSKSEQSFLYKKIEKAMKKWKRKQLRKAKHLPLDFTQFNLNTSNE